MKFAFIIILFSLSVAFSQDYHSNRIVVKLSGNTIDSATLSKYVGEFTVTDFISSELLSRYPEPQTLSISKVRSTADNLRAIKVIHYEREIDPLILAKKIERLPFIEYAEPDYIDSLFYIPNDYYFSEQYHFEITKLNQLWEYLDPNLTITIGIVDTGIDYDHEDLKDVIYINEGETGLDENGNDKRYNGIDDDGNGYIDDYRGWDFVSGGDTPGDNDPRPGNSHGTHVAGIAGASIDNELGVAGAATNVKLMPVKVSGDGIFDRSISNGYEGVLYAALNGAEVINCSWGSSSASEANGEIIKAVIDLGALIVAAAGNDNSDTEFYPAAYPGVLSVAATTQDNVGANWTNYSYSVDVSAPGDKIFSTLPLNDYGNINGTSMASPIVAGYAAMALMLYPEMNAEEITELIKIATTNIDVYNPGKFKKLGTGIIDAEKFLNIENPKAIKMLEIKHYNNEREQVYTPESKINIDLSFKNILNDISNGFVRMEFVSNFINSPAVSVYNFGEMKSKEIISGIEPFTIDIPEILPTDYKLDIMFIFYDGAKQISRQGTTITLNQSFINISDNNISTTVNSIGNFAFNDFPSNNQGIGFKYKGKQNMLYEGALMMAVNDSTLSNSARGTSSRVADRDFIIERIISKSTSEYNYTSYTTDFRDKNIDENIGVRVRNIVHQINAPILEDAIIINYDIINICGRSLDSLFAGIYMDWDIGSDISSNYTYYNEKLNYGVVKSTVDSMEVIGIKQVSSHRANFFAIDNDGNSPENPGVYDGFSKAEKWLTLSSGIARKTSTVTDVSAVISAGPLMLPDSDTLRVSFLIMVAGDEAELESKMIEVESLLAEFVNPNGDLVKFNNSPQINSIYPNPVSGDEVEIEFTLNDKESINFEICDASGRTVQKVNFDSQAFIGINRTKINIGNLAQGVYFVKLFTNEIVIHKSFVILK